MLFAATRQKIWYKRKAFWRSMRMLYPSPAEVQFLKLFGAKAITIDAFMHPKTKFPMTFIYKKGRFLRRNFMQREVRVGGFYVDLAFVDAYRKLAIEIDGKDYHRDLVRERERDEYLNRRGWTVLHIAARDLYGNPGRVQYRVRHFLSK